MEVKTSQISIGKNICIYWEIIRFHIKCVAVLALGKKGTKRKDFSEGKVMSYTVTSIAAGVEISFQA